MNIKEQDVLKKVFWPESKKDISGTMVHSLTTEDFSETMEVSVSRTKDRLDIFYSVAPTFKPEAEKVYLVKMFFDRNGDELNLNVKKTSPEISTPEGITETLNIIENNIVKMNTKPAFFATGVINNTPKKKYIRGSE